MTFKKTWRTRSPAPSPKTDPTPKPTGVMIYGVNYAPEPTGIGPYTTELAEELVRLGNSVKVVTIFPHYPSWQMTGRTPGSRSQVTLENGVSVRRLPAYMPRPMSAAKRMLFEFTYFAQALIHGPGKSEVIVGVVPGLGSGLAAAIHARLRRRRLVIVLQDLAGQGLKQSGLKSAKRLARFAMAAERWILTRADKVIAISSAYVTELLNAGVSPETIEVLPNWARVAGAAFPDLATLRPDEQVTIVHAGSMGSKQGLSSVIETAALAASEGLSWKFEFVGDGSERKRLEAQSHLLPNVTFRDPVCEEMVPTLLASASVLLVSQLPSNRDMSFPSKLTSYFASGRPVVASVPDGGAVSCFLLNTGTGVCSPAGAPGELLDALRSVLDNPEVGNLLAKRAQKYLMAEWGRPELLTRWCAAILAPQPDDTPTVLTTSGQVLEPIHDSVAYA